MIPRANQIVWATLLFALLFTAPSGYAGNLSWTLPTSYVDGTPIDSADANRIVVRVYAGPTRTGPWNWVASSMPGATHAAVMDPMPGHTLWYTVKTTLDGAESDYAVPVRKTNLAILKLPVVKKVMEKMITPKKMIVLSFLFLLIVSGWFIRHRRRFKEKRR